MRPLGEIADAVVAKLRRGLLAGRVYALGPRAFHELLEELLDLYPVIRGDLDDCLERFARLDPETVKALHADQLAPAPLTGIDGGRRG